MTRELLFLTTFESAFASATGWNSAFAKEGGPLAPSDFPAFVLMPGEARYTYDSSGSPIAGSQAFDIKITFAHSQLAMALARATRSDYIGLVDSFFSGYTPPAVTPGDPARIDGIILTKVSPSVLNKRDTQSTIIIQASYFFTLL